MKRQNILITACSLAAVSLGGNIWLLMHRNEKAAPVVQEKGPPALPAAADFDFSDTAFADGSWKLSDKEDDDPPVSLDKPFSFEEFKAPPGAEIPRDSSGLGLRSGPVNSGRRKFGGFFDAYHGDTPPDSAPPQK